MASVDDPKTFGNRVEKFLRERHPNKTADHVAAMSGCSRAQVAKWLEGASTPSGPALARLLLAYGPAFMAAFMGDLTPRWLDDDVREQRMAELAARRRAIEDEMQSLLPGN